MRNTLDLPTPNGSRAAQYVRMSTDNQKYSPENQKDAMAAYAAGHGLTIVRTYFDKGRSGINIEGRDALRKLIDDVKSGCTDFQFILVYDISRWGRFQDIDESAYYEFVCKEAGIQIIYCAEPFENDGSLASALMKTIKRGTAGEFVRELSSKVFIGQSRIAKMGFWRGGFPAFGLRRQLLDAGGMIRGPLAFGQRKCLQADRVVLVLGPAIEVETVRRIFNSFVHERKGESQIAAELNADRITTTLGNRWEPETLTKLLTNEHYLGHIIFNRSSAKLKTKIRANPPEMWIRSDNAFLPLVDPDLFQQAQEILRKRRLERSERSMLDRLTVLRKEKGYLTANMIDADDDLPSAQTLHRHYGSLMAAYKLIDYQPTKFVARAKVRTIRRSMLEKAATRIATGISKQGGKAELGQDYHLHIDDDICVSICAARANGERLRRMRWYAQVDRHAKSDLTLVLRFNVSDTAIDACYLLPTSEFARAKRNSLRITDRMFVEACRFEHVDQFCDIWRGASRERAAT